MTAPSATLGHRGCTKSLAFWSVTVDELLTALAASFGVPAPNAQERETILALAGQAAHLSERQAAPIACWLAGRAGIELDVALATARALSTGQH